MRTLLFLTLVLMSPGAAFGLCRPSAVISAREGITREQAETISSIFTGRLEKEWCRDCAREGWTVQNRVHVNEVFWGSIQVGQVLDVQLYWADLSKFDSIEDHLFYVQSKSGSEMVLSCAVSGKLSNTEVFEEVEWLRENPGSLRERMELR